MKLNDDKFSMFQMASLFEDWRGKYHSDKKGNIIFQNKDLLTNVVLPADYLHQGHVHNRGFANIPDTIDSPSEVWSKWVNPKKQDSVIRYYILIGENINYVVTTIDGKIKHAQGIVSSKLAQYRSGIILLKK